MMTVTIEGVDYSSYADVATADAYLVASYGANTWRLPSTNIEVRSRALITATRVMDRQRWAEGYKTQVEREDVQNIIDACCEIASALLEGSDLESTASTEQKLQSITAGSVSLTYFRGADGVPHRFPVIIWELLRDYLVGASAVAGGIATGTGGVSLTEDQFGHSDAI